MGSAFGANIGIALQKFYISHQESTGVAGGGATSGSWQTRTLNNIILNEVPGASLASNQIVLPAGTYRIRSFSPANSVNGFKSRLRNITDSVNVFEGTSALGPASGSAEATSMFDDTFVLSATKTLEVQTQVQSTKATNAYGFPTPFATDNETYIKVLIEREIPATNDGNGILVNGPLFHAQDQKSSGTNGGSSTVTTWTTRVLNTELTSAIVGVSLSANKITLPAGSYYVKARSPEYRTNSNRARIQDTTGSVTLLTGSSMYANNSGNVNNDATVMGQFTLGAESEIELQYWANGTGGGASALGVATTTGVPEVYGEIEIWKLVKAGANTADVVNSPLLHIEDQKSTGTAGGTFTSGAFRTRDLTTIVTNEVGASLSSNQITLLAGLYWLEITAPAYEVETHLTRWYNISDASVEIAGTIAYASNPNVVQTTSTISGRFTITSTKTFELQHECNFSSPTVNGFGQEASNHVTVNPLHELYSVVKIWKLS